MMKRHGKWRLKRTDMNNIQPLNTDRDHCAPTVLAGYFKFGSRTLLLGDYGTTGGVILIEYE